MLSPGNLCCARIAVTCIQRTIFTKPESIVPFSVERAAVFHSAWLSESGVPGLVLINYTGEPQAVTIGRADELMPDDGRWERCLHPRSACFVPLTRRG